MADQSDARLPQNSKLARRLEGRRKLFEIVQERTAHLTEAEQLVEFDRWDEIALDVGKATTEDDKLIDQLCHYLGAKPCHRTRAAGIIADAWHCVLCGTSF